MSNDIPIQDHQDSENLQEKVKEVAVDDAHKTAKVTKLGRDDMNPEAGSN